MMSVTFEKQMFMPHGPLGPTTCMGMGIEKRIIRWYSKEWAEFLTEITAYKHRILEKQRTCVHCMKTRTALRKYQRGVLMAIARRRIAAGGGDCSFTQSTIPNLQDEVIEPTNARTRGRLHTDGDWYSTTGSTGFGGSDGTWQGDCPVADYDSRWLKVSGTSPNAAVSGVDGVWSDASVTGAAIGFDQTSFGSKFGSFTAEIRDAASLNVLFGDGFTMSVNVDSSS